MVELADRLRRYCVEYFYWRETITDLIRTPDFFDWLNNYPTAPSPKKMTVNCPVFQTNLMRKMLVSFEQFLQLLMTFCPAHFRQMLFVFRLTELQYLQANYIRRHIDCGTQFCRKLPHLGESQRRFVWNSKFAMKFGRNSLKANSVPKINKDIITVSVCPPGHSNLVHCISWVLVI